MSRFTRRIERSGQGIRSAVWHKLTQLARPFRNGAGNLAPRIVLLGLQPLDDQELRVRRFLSKIL